MSATSAVAVLFLVVLAGLIARKLGILTDEVSHAVSRLITQITLPCLTLTSMQRPFSAELLQGFLISLGLGLLIIPGSILLGWALFSARKRERRALLANFCGFSNCGFMGYPIIEAINPAWMIYAVGFNVAYNLSCWSIAVMLISGEKKIDLKKILLNQNIIASVIGFALFCAGFRWPDVLFRGMDYVGGLTTPLSMLLIGARLSGIRLKELRDMDYHWIALLRNLVLPLAVLGLLFLLPLPSDIRQVVFILTAMPLGTLIAMLAELYNGEAAFAARSVAWTTLLSLGTIPLLSLLMPLIAAY
ncbi:MAG: AEC family transporter [Clostridia bacterium]|nr:AEC family transporter [Clostridia bacterium]